MTTTEQVKEVKAKLHERGFANIQHTRIRAGRFVVYATNPRDGRVDRFETAFDCSLIDAYEPLDRQKDRPQPKKGKPAYLQLSRQQIWDVLMQSHRGEPTR